MTIWQLLLKFASDLDRAIESDCLQGRRLQELLKQPQYSPFTHLNEQVAILYTDNGYLDDIQNWKKLALSLKELQEYLQTSKPQYGS